MIDKTILFIDDPVIGSSTWKEIENKFKACLDPVKGYKLSSLPNEVKNTDLRISSDNLCNLIVKHLESNQRVTIVAHGISCPVLLMSILSLINRGRSNLLRKIDQVILISPSLIKKGRSLNLLSILVHSFKTGFSKFLIAKKILSEASNRDQGFKNILAKVYKNIINADRFSDQEAMVPIVALFSQEDNLLSRKNIQEIFNHIINIQQGFFDSLFSPSEQLFSELNKLLEIPVAHRNVFNIKKSEIDISISPLPHSVLEVRQEKIILNHNASFSFKLLLTDNNICRSKYLLRFAVGSNGNIDEKYIGDIKNETDSSNIGRFEREGNEYILEFVPKKFKDYRVELEIQNGFDDSQYWDRTQPLELVSEDIEKRQYFAFSIGEGKNKYSLINLKLSLTSYLEEDYEIFSLELFVIDESINFEYRDSSEIEKIILGSYQAISPQTINEGVFQWQISNIQKGAALLTWLVKKK